MIRTYDELIPWGWSAHWDGVLQAAAPSAGVHPARVTAVDRGRLSLHGTSGALHGIWRPRDDRTPPTVGDWCLVEPPPGDGPAMVRARLPRRTHLSRKAPGRAAEPQVLAANVDSVALVCGLDRSQGIRSLERLLTLVLDGGAVPRIVLNKADTCDDLPGAMHQAQAAAPGFDVFAVSALTGDGLEPLQDWMVPGSTIALLGPSGVGKSTLVNALAGRDLAATGAVRSADRRGRHTTSRRQLHPLPGGALLVDTPGLRELAVWTDGDGLAEAFADIEALATSCRFRDCRHDDEPGCAVREALDTGALEPRRFWRYLELGQEADALARRRQANKGNSKRRFKDISRFSRKLRRERERE